MSQPIIRYYRGELTSQFSTANAEKFGNGGHMQSQIVLEPRFKLYNAIEITEAEFPTFSYYQNLPYIFQESSCELEIYLPNDTNNGIRKTANGILMIRQKIADASSWNNDQIIPWGNYHLESDLADLQENFIAHKDKVNHGKISGLGYCRTIEYVLPDGITIDPRLKNNRGCFSLLGGKGNLQNNRGCMSLFGANGNLQNNGGCLNMLGGGLFGGGCAKSGCGLLIFLPLLYFLWSMFFGSNKTAQNQVNPTVIHDTVYVEVIKDRVDTLTVIRMDTVSYVDSNNKTTYEMVSLPNVQFYTNSDVLLPTSAKDLQQLAEYLTKNDSLNATIFGHTDNTGDPKYNLYLSQKRAESVMKFLTSLGIDSDRLKAKGMGDLAPKGDNTTKEGRLMNRRVEVTLTETEKTVKKRTQIPNKKK